MARVATTATARADDRPAELARTPARMAEEGGIGPAQLDAIMAVSAAVAQDAALEDTLERIAETAASLVSAQAAAIILRESESTNGMTIAGSFGLGKRYAEHLKRTRPLEVGQGPSGMAAQSGRPVCVEDFLVDERCKPWRGLAIQEQYRGMLCVPLRLGEDRVIGVLTAYRATPGPWSPHEIDLASLLADHAAIAIRTADLLDRARRQVSGLSLMVRSLRAQAHEHANRLHAIYGLLTLDEVDAARRLIAAVEEGYHGIYASVSARVQNPTIAGLLVAESAIARESGIEVTLDRRSRMTELPPGLSDLDAVTILGNLLHNAVDAVAEMPRSRRRVTVGLLERPAETVIRVRDWGPGIPAGDMERIFERDFTTKPSHSGVGLHLVDSVVRRTGGRISVERMRPSGVAFSVGYAR